MLYEDGLRRARAQANPRLEARLLGGLAIVAVDEGRGRGGALPAEGELPDVRASSTTSGEPVRTSVAARTPSPRSGRAATAAQLLGGSDAVFEGIGARPPWLARMNDQTLAAIREQLEEPAVAEAREQGRALTVDEAVALALDSFD